MSGGEVSGIFTDKERHIFNHRAYPRQVVSKHTNPTARVVLGRPSGKETEAGWEGTSPTRRWCQCGLNGSLDSHLPVRRDPSAPCKGGVSKGLVENLDFARIWQCRGGNPLSVPD